MINPGFDPEFAAAADWARLYRANGVQIVPCKNKIPRLKSWKEYQNALVPDAQFEAWYGHGGEFAQSYDMGALTGTASGRMLMIDLDVYKAGGEVARRWWDGVLAVHNNGMEPETWKQITGGGGVQLFFTYPPDWKFAVNAKTDINVDIRCQGGFAVLPPTRHASGGTYIWVDGNAPWEIPIALAPDWLLAEVEKLIREHGGGTQPSANGAQTGATGTQTSATGQYDAFGHQTDGREDKMYKQIWAALVGLRIDSPIPPSMRDEERIWAEYERGTEVQEPQPGETKLQGLEREKRGTTEFHKKWLYTLKKWDTEITEAAKVREAEEAKQGPGYTDYTEEFQKDRVDPDTGQPKPIEWLDMSNWDNVPVPVRKWAIRDRVPLNQVGLFSGEGGTGKSIIELMKNVAHVTGKEWFGSLPEQGGAFYLGAEDEAEEIHIRLAAIAVAYGTTFRELTAGGLKVLPLLGQDSMLCVQAGRGNHIETTALYKQLYEAAGDLKPKNISIDTLSRAFGGDEINRVQVYAFAMHMQAVAKVAQGSVTILSHPSLAGMANGSGISGSTAWHGAFRFRQYLKGIKEDDDDDPGADDLRELEFKKNQYGPKGRPVILRYENGLFVPVNGATDPERLAREARADGLFVNLLRRFNARGDTLSHVKKSIYYGPTVLADEPEAKQQGFRKGDLEDAMRRLMAAGRVLVETYGKGSRPQRRLVLAPGT
jgi:RecA-family ATPase